MQINVVHGSIEDVNLKTYDSNRGLNTQTKFKVMKDYSNGHDIWYIAFYTDGDYHKFMHVAGNQALNHGLPVVKTCAQSNYQY